jgi:hypothetical protein
MARIRTIKPEFFTSEDIVGLSPLARLLYIALWCEADREGRLVWKPKTFKMRYFPGDKCDIDALCNEILDANLVIQYGECYSYIPTFHSHQHLNPRESKTQLPEPNIDAIVTRAPRVSDAQGGREGKGRERKTKETQTRFEDFWSAWPKSDRKQDKAKCHEKWVDLNLDTLLVKILADVEAKKLTRKWQDDDGKFIEAPLVYLNNKRWEDGSCSQSALIAWAGAI